VKKNRLNDAGAVEANGDDFAAATVDVSIIISLAH